MKIPYLILPLMVTMLLLAACASNKEPKAPKLVTKYDIALTKVSRMGELNGKSRSPVADTTIVNKLRYRYEDDYVRTIWSASENGFEVTWYNASQKNISINWEQGQYLDYDNIGHRLLISSTKDADITKPQPSSVIVPRGNLVETIFSADNVIYSSLLGLYSRTPLLPTDYATAVRYNGKEMKIILPVTVDGFTQNYEHIFKVKNVRQIAVKKTSIFGL